jgi:hypothetical protein
MFALLQHRCFPALDKSPLLITPVVVVVELPVVADSRVVDSRVVDSKVEWVADSKVEWVADSKVAWAVVSKVAWAADSKVAWAAAWVECAGLLVRSTEQKILNGDIFDRGCLAMLQIGLSASIENMEKISPFGYMTSPH